MAGHLVPGVRRRPHLLLTWALTTLGSTKGTLGILKSQRQASPRTSNPRERANKSYLFMT